MNIIQLLEQPPKLHRDSYDQEISWGISEGLMTFLDKTLYPGMNCLETGAGISTIIFAMHGVAHKSIMPDVELATRIRDFCDSNEIDTSGLSFHIGPSENILPDLELEELDIVLIDGRHGFPAPFIDWYYTAKALKVGGLTIVDDTDLWTGKVLRDFLDEDVSWEIVRDIDAKAAVFRKKGEGSHTREWHQQAFVRNHSRYQPESKAAHALRSHKLGRAKELFRQRKFLTLLKRSVLEIVKR
ncbi:MAG: class I SAM-dependent methyltransferase [Pseudomonadota bacterium]